MRSLPSYLRRVSVRLAVLRAACHFARWAIGCTLLAVLAVPLCYVGPSLSPVSLLQAYLILLSTLLLSCMTISMLRAPSLARAARHVDRQFHLQELLETAISTNDAGQQSPFASAVRSAAVSRIRLIPPGAAVPLKFSPLHSTAGAAVMAFALLTLSLPVPRPPQAPALLSQAPPSAKARLAAPQPTSPQKASPQPASQPSRVQPQLSTASPIAPTHEIPADPPLPANSQPRPMSSTPSSAGALPHASGFAPENASPAPGHAQSAPAPTRIADAAPTAPLAIPAPPTLPPSPSLTSAPLPPANVRARATFADLPSSAPSLARRPSFASPSSSSPSSNSPPSNSPPSTPLQSIPLDDLPPESHELIRRYFNRGSTDPSNSPPISPPTSSSAP